MKHTFLKATIAMVTAVVLAAGIYLGLVAYAENSSAKVTEKAAAERLEMMEPVISELEMETANSTKWFAENTSNNLKMMQAALQALITNGRYYGPRMFEDGMVVSVEDGKVVFPEEMPENFIEIADGLDLTKAAANPSSWVIGTLNEPGEDPQEVILSSVEIADGLYYLDWKLSEELADYVKIHDRTKEALNAAEKSIGGLMFLLDAEQQTDGSEVKGLKYVPDELEMMEDGDLITELMDLINSKDDKDKELTVGDIDYFISTKKLSNLDEYLVLMMPYRPSEIESRLELVILCLAMLVIAIALIVYLTSVQNHVKSYRLKSDEKLVWHPTRMLKKALAVGLISTVVMFGASTFVQTLIMIQESTLEAQGALNRLAKLEKNGGNDLDFVFDEITDAGKQEDKNAAENKASDGNDDTKQEAADGNAAAETAANTVAQPEKKETGIAKSAQTSEEKWYVYFGERIASLLKQYPELSTREKLQEFCDALQIDYIMLFDSNGNEVLCNQPYYGCSLGVGQGENGEDFRRLLNGVPSIVHPASADDTIGLTRQNIGVSLPLKDGAAPGAMIMALLPEQTQRTMEYEEITSPLNYLFDTIMYFAADSGTGEIKTSSLGGVFEGMNISNLSLSESTLIDGYMGFSVIQGMSAYLVTKGQNSLVYYHIRDAAELFTGVLPMGGIAAAAFLILYLILTAILFIGFTKKAFEKWSAVGETQGGSSLSGHDVEGWPDEPEPVDTRSKWQRMLPEEKSTSVFRVSLCILFLLIIVYEALMLTYKDDAGPSLFQFIVSGNWMRGFNLFSFCAIVLMIIAAFLLVSFLNWLLGFLPMILTHNGDTIRILLYSVVKYGAVLVVLYFSLDYLGFNPATIVASLGVVGLALSFGAKDMIADIFAGVTIIFEDSFQVGDAVMIGNFRGVIENIGIRTTKIVNGSKNVKIINNKDIKDVINLSKYNARVSVVISIPATQSLTKVREILERELPAIGEKNDNIIAGPFYNGVTEVRGYIVKLRFRAECDGRYFMAVNNYLNEEILEMMKREGIEIIRPLHLAKTAGNEDLNENASEGLNENASEGGNEGLNESGDKGTNESGNKTANENPTESGNSAE